MSSLNDAELDLSSVSYLVCRDTSVNVITDLMYQVAQGMAYLESCKFVHRDLAARNVLLVTQRFAKISDFGMSKALNFGNDYYRAASAGKWPLKWYAPECIYYFRFDSKSDVWSYGITLWEVFSFGERPYKDMKGAQILSMLDQGLRLSRPARCPEAVYAVMRECWNFEGVRRPTFAELVLTMSRLSKSMLSSSSSSTTKEGSTAFPPPPSGFEPVSCKSSVIPSATGSSGGSGVNSSASDMAFF
uniref:Tyrosine-protein kinase SYK n=1 Tax=Schistocephalus solidus TaxID=70667 RepID=A0A0X3PTF0_SCHSO